MRPSGRTLTAAVAMIVLLLTAAAGFAGTFSARISKVNDGDSLVVSQKGRLVDVELAGVRAPGLSQDLGRQARELLTQIAHRREARVEVVREGLNRALVARVEVEGQDLATALIKAGLARPTSEATEAQLAAAKAARAAEVGLWAAKVGTPSSPNRKGA